MSSASEKEVQERSHRKSRASIRSKKLADKRYLSKKYASQKTLQRLNRANAQLLVKMEMRRSSQTLHKLLSITKKEEVSTTSIAESPSLPIRERLMQLESAIKHTIERDRWLVGVLWRKGT